MEQLWNYFFPKQPPKLETTRTSKYIVKTNQITDTAQEVFKHLSSNDRSIPYHSEQLWYNDHTSKHLPIIRKLLDESAALIEPHFKIDKQKWFVESHSYNATQQQGVTTPLAWHQDDYGGWPEQVCTVLWYLRKDSTLIGGNFCICDSDPENYDVFSRKSIQQTKDIITIPINNHTVIIMSGDIWHCPENLQGTGSRDLVVVQFKQLS